MQTTLQGAIEIKGQDINNVCQKDGKDLARLDWVTPWLKNPKIAVDKDINKLCKKIEELGVYKPLVITPDGTILGGNQRYKALKKLQQKNHNYDWVWVSIVEAWDDSQKLKYALSDNEQVGKYTREKLQEVLSPYLNQGNLFSEYNIEIKDWQSVDKFIEELTLTQEEIEFKDVKKILKKQGINDETLKALETMTNFSKIKEELEDVDLKGKITGQKFPLLFWINDEVSFEEYKKIYGTKYKDKYDELKLKFVTETILDVHIPTVPEELEKLERNLNELNKRLVEYYELNAKPETIEKTKELISKTKERIEELNPNQLTIE